MQAFSSALSRPPRPEALLQDHPLAVFAALESPGGELEDPPSSPERRISDLRAFTSVTR
jgi:hypothetical protein